MTHPLPPDPPSPTMRRLLRILKVELIIVGLLLIFVFETTPSVPANIQHSIDTNHFPPIIGLNCGQTYGDPDMLTIPGYPNTPGAANCLLHAFQHCQTATLVHTDPGIDTPAIIDQVTVQSSFQSHVLTFPPTCLVTDSGQFIVSRFAHLQVFATPCTGLRQQDGFLYITGCQGDCHFPGWQFILLCQVSPIFIGTFF